MVADEVERLLDASISDNTHKTYATGWKAFTQFKQQTMSTSPHGSVGEIHHFIAWLSLQGLASSTIATYVSSVGYVHKLRGLTDPTKDFVVSKLLEGARRLRPCKDSRLPISLPLLRDIISALPTICLNQFESTLFRAVFLSAFFGFMRVSEIAVGSRQHLRDSVLCCHDVTFSQLTAKDQSVTIQLRQSKNNQRGPPQCIHLVENTDQYLCPVSALRQFSAIRPQFLGPYFCHFDGSPLTQYQFNAVLQEALAFIGLDGARITSHSFRIGAASSASQLGVANNDIQCMGRWRSDAFLTYVRPLPLGSVATRHDSGKSHAV